MDPSAFSGDAPQRDAAGQKDRNTLDPRALTAVFRPRCDSPAPTCSRPLLLLPTARCGWPLMCARFPGFAGSPPTTRSTSNTSRRSSPATRGPRALGRARSRARSAHRRRARRDRARSSPRSRSGAQRRGRARERPPTLADPRPSPIVTGQQAGLFGGPLFTLLKALTAIRLAARASAASTASRSCRCSGSTPRITTGTRSASCGVLDADQTLRRDRGARRPTARANCTGRAADAHRRHRRARWTSSSSALPRHRVHAASCSTRSATPMQPGRGMADAFGRWLERVLGPHGLVVYDASDPAAKPLARADLRARARARRARPRGWRPRPAHELVSARLSRAGDAARGSRRAVPPRRRPRGRSGQPGRVTLTIGDEPVAARRSSSAPRSSPSTFSPNVLLRPLVQDTLFPTICYVAGPERAGVSRAAARRLRRISACRCR